MSKESCIKCIVEGIERYFRMFARSGIVENHKGNIEWIRPLPGAVGPSIVYKITLDDDRAGVEIDSMIPDLKNGVIPSFWYITPTSTPGNIIDILTSKGFKSELPTDDSEKEYGMAMELCKILEWPEINPKIEVKRVQTKANFKQWIDTVNTALHGWNMIDVEHYYIWMLENDFAFYVGYLNDIPVSTAATITGNENASLEFVSTLAEYRNQGAATAVCIEALKELQSNGVRTVTLGSSPEATSLYMKLGFLPYFEKRLMTFKG